MNFVKKVWAGFLSACSSVVATLRSGARLFFSILFIFVLGYLLSAVVRSDWHYAYQEGHIVRSWCIKLPGVREYFDINETPPVKRWDFSLYVPYRVSPWYPTEEEDNKHVSPNGAAPGSFVYDAEAWAIHQGLTIPLENVHPGMYQGMLDDFENSPHGRKFIQ